MGARNYRKYPEAVRLQIARTGNPYLFPEYKIPRTTANYWIKTAASLPTPPTDEDLVKKRIRALERELEKARALTKLVEKVRAAFPSSFKGGRVPSKPIRKRIVDAILEAVKLNKVGDCLKLIDLSKSTYSRWLSELFLCESLEKACFQRKPHQLTLDEIQSMKKLATSKKHSHFSIMSLCLWAQRHGVLACSVDSWYKYMRIFGWIRPRACRKTRVEQEGFRTKRPNEVWHIDVTEVMTLDGQTVFIQVVYDNFSRFILAWTVSKDIGALNTVALIERAKSRAGELTGESVQAIMSDGGPENDNHRVLNFLTAENVRRLIARVDIRFSNSMVESLFRMLKSNFLRTEELHSFRDVERKVDFFFTEHNEVIPKIQIGGATPKEKYLNHWGQEQVEGLKSALVKAAEKRKAEFKAISCAKCIA